MNNNMNQSQNQINNMPVGAESNTAYGVNDPGRKDRTPYLVATVVVVVVLAFVWWWFSRPDIQSPALTPEAALGLEQINQDLDELDIGDLDKEFDQIDQDLDTL